MLYDTKVAQNASSDATDTDALKMAHIKRYFNDVLPKRYQSIKNADEATLVDLIKRQKSLIITGGVGTGKTYRMYELYLGQFVRYWMKNLYHIGHNEFAENLYMQKCFYNIPELLQDLRKEYDGQESSLIKDLKKAEVLFLDDLGVEKVSDWVKEQMYIVINHRYENVKLTIYSTNLTIAEIAKTYGERIASRLVESCDIIKLEGQDKRTLDKVHNI